jgi:LmbE family N-acetylglucosaminyl deacetylase
MKPPGSNLLQTDDLSDDPFDHSCDHPLRSPLCKIEQITAEPILVVAPHPDDETLGCGGAIASLRALGLMVWVLVMSDGTQSHPHSKKYPAPKLRMLRESETQDALNILGVDAAHITFFRLQDGALPKPDSSEFKGTLEQCCDYLKTIAPVTLFLPCRTDPHPDHRATWHLMTEALERCSFFPRVIEYPVWDWDIGQRQTDDRRSMTAWRLDISDVAEMKRSAIAAYRSQTTSLIDDDPQGFCLTPQMLTHFTQPWELYLEAKR